MLWQGKNTSIKTNNKGFFVKFMVFLIQKWGEFWFELGLSLSFAKVWAYKKAEQFAPPFPQILPST